MDKEDARHLPLAVLNERRRRAVTLRERRLTLRKVAAQVELSLPTVMAAHRAYLAGGRAAVNVKPRGRKRGEGRQLTVEQETGIRWLLCDNTPLKKAAISHLRKLRKLPQRVRKYFEHTPVRHAA